MTPAHPRRVLLAGVIVTGLVLTASGCSSSGGGGASAQPPGAASSTILIKDFGYTVPASVKPGAKLTVRNEDGVAHTVTTASGRAFDVKVGPSATATMTAPTQPGSYAFTCTYHPYMRATLVVKR